MTAAFGLNENYAGFSKKVRMADTPKKQSVVEILKKIFNEQNAIFLFVYLFGSLAHETHSVSSDIDIAVYLNRCRIQRSPPSLPVFIG